MVIGVGNVVQVKMKQVWKLIILFRLLVVERMILITCRHYVENVIE